MRILPGRCLFIALAVAFFIAPYVHGQQTAGPSGTDRNAVFAREEFRLGVQAYNRFSFNEAILSFERALSFRPGEPLILDWLGRAYYRSGMEDTALRQWQAALEFYERGSNEALLLASRIETVWNRRSLFPDLDENARYVDAGRYPGRYDDLTVYRQPTAVLPLEDGSAWVVAFGSNEIVRIDVNGIIRQRQRGPLNGFDRPYDIVRGPDGRLYVSEYHGGRVSILSSRGEWQGYIGSKGRGDGQFVGPQNMAVDEDGYLYVVDYGNRRVSKFDADGTYLLSFGGKTGTFPGFTSPTGIAAGNGSVYVADSVNRTVYRFDRNGSYLGITLSEGLQGPESLRFTSDGRLLAADTNRVVIIDPQSAVVHELGVVGNSRVRLVGADVDRNGNILAVNFQADEISVMTRLDDMAAGLFVQIERIVSDNFPEVTLELQVQDRQRRPIVGLDGRNFLLSEEGRAAGEQSFLGAAYLSDRTDISLLIERSPQTAGFRNDLAVAARDAAAASGRVVSVVSAGEQPFLERSADAAQLDRAARGTDSQYSPRWRFDLGLRLAATDLLPGEKKRAVVFLTSGALNELSFSQYSLSELAAYLANNGIVFYAVIIGNASPSREVEYLCSQTGGSVLPLYRPAGIGPVIEGLKEKPNGTYILRYRSGLPTDFGRAYLPVEAEVYLLERSGRDGTGYFPPLE
ncbi:6-bladed beta-propeller [Breznakiella homolactica]|uniref:6-bladed beta-propeller n=1 Tax=Breznakiella homolactica TaxID=2798577 RepID=A0A7T7XKD1_9SPIR|nr:6-bladed beta-propeller [Breznakiella homolactica]QQO08004.1 6-bladed beta-propeller [Breznakiella homolactica]